MVARYGSVLARRGEYTPDEGAIDALHALADLACEDAGERPAAAGVGFGGPVDVRSGRVRTSFLRSGWEGLPLGEMLADRLGMPTWLANDADAAGLGEARFGAGRGCKSILYVNVGTGIGGAIVIGGQLHVGATSSAGEIGHLVLKPDGPECQCGKTGCLQALSSGPAIARLARERLRTGESGSLLAGTEIDEVTGHAVGEAARDGDPLAVDVIEEAAGWLGLGLANAAHLLDPELIVIGGGVAGLGPLLFDPLREAYRSHIFGPATQTPVVPAELGYDAGVIGAATVAMVGAGARAEP